MPYLEGKKVSSDRIDPTMHILVGKFRDPTFQDFISCFGFGFDAVRCNCGCHLWTNESLYEHWMRGHFDEHIYIKYTDEYKINEIIKFLKEQMEKYKYRLEDFPTNFLATFALDIYKEILNKIEE